ncbi:sensor histidine kinase [Phenylobacterium zucineum HLK1]|uniref:histidine kinase n=1 Tax=Phenylobacterium zucineum (strain HLK1) TaxID=450851 RepID=B4RHJ0_PHEZH|nr:response regulator [Phenylobacterium zucineum]ACG77450.1 sensor histidine kinase [Phenylobacterium zucineum HLK1]
MKLAWPDLTDRRQVGLAWMAALALTAFALLLGGFNELNYRRSTAADAVAQAQLLAGSVSGALAFQDRETLSEQLGALRLNPAVVSAAAYDARGRPLVAYAKEGSAAPPQTAPPPGARRLGGAVLVTREVTESGVRLGAVYLSTRPQPLAGVLMRHGGLAVLTLVAYALLAVLTRAGLQLQRRADELATANERLTVEMAEREKAEEALRQSQKMEALGQLTGGIAHDFNNLLQVVQGAFELISRRADDPAKVKAYAAHGLHATERGASLAKQLLAFSRAQKLELKPFVVADLIRDMRQLLVRTLGPNVTLDFRFDDDKIAVVSDRTQLELAVLNLAINARDAMPDGGTLTIVTRPRPIPAGHPTLPPDTYLELCVSDTGKGMPAEVAERAFDPFFTTKGVGKGTGLGLSQVYGVARQAGGEAVIQTAPGEGTTVSLLLRRSDAAPAERPEAARAEAGHAAPPNARVMVVDDDDEVRRLVCDSLDLLGYEVEAAGDGPTALAELDRVQPDLLLLDFAMPGMNGAEVATAARARRGGLPIVFASGYAETDAVRQAVGRGAVILRKPFEIDDLARVVREALSQAPRPQTGHGPEKDTGGSLTLDGGAR